MNNLKIPRSIGVPTFVDNSPSPPPPPPPTPTPHQPTQQRNNFSLPHKRLNAQNLNKTSTNHVSRSPHPPRNDKLPLDYHLRQQRVTDNPKKIPKFDFIRAVPKGSEYAIYIEPTTMTFCDISSSVPYKTITHKSNIRNTLFFATKINDDFFVITNILMYNGESLSTYGERLTILSSMFKNGVLTTDIHFSLNYLFKNWNDFSRESLHIPYEIKHLEYCFYNENLNRQRDRYIYILNKKNLKNHHDLVHTISREFRVDRSAEEHQQQPQSLLDFKTCILRNIPYLNIVGYSHLDKQEESDDEY